MTTQLSIFDDFMAFERQVYLDALKKQQPATPDPKPLSRRSDPDTSRLAAAHAAASLPALQASALSWVRRRPGLTATELAREAGEGDPRVFNRRLGELQKLGQVTRGEARRCRVRGGRRRRGRSRNERLSRGRTWRQSSRSRRRTPSASR